jgi:hypothetical protein
MESLVTLQKREKAFNDFSKCFPRDTLAKWESLDITPRKNGDTVISVYQAQLKNGKLHFICSFRH